MLRELRIRSLGVIDEAEIELGPGLNVVTGETGAGKTMVVQSLGLLFGARADPGLVRSGATAAAVEGVIEGSTDHAAFARAREAGADVEDELLLVRTISAAGRSRAIAGGRTVPAGLLAELAEQLVVVHGQSDQWRLRSADEQRNLLDAFGGETLRAALADYGTAYQEWQLARRRVAELTELTRTRTADLHALRSGVARIEALDPQPDEDVHLKAEDERLGHAEGLRVAALEASTLLLGDDVGSEVVGAISLLGRARAALGAQSEHDPQLAELATRAADVAALLSDLGAELSSYADRIDLDGERLAAVQLRRSALREVTRDFGGDVATTLAWLGAASERLLAVDTAADDLAQARREEEESRRRAGELAGILSAARAEAATELGDRVTAELAHLAMGSAQVAIDLSSRADPDGITRPGDDEPVRASRYGCDEVEFRFRSGPGLPERPITRSASGGELSRVMLAIEVVLGDRVAAVPTYVFDEVDAGVGGAAAVDVGARLARLARSAQVIVVTHLPQVAAFADRHHVVTKATDGQVTASDVRQLTDDEREIELARMMAGTDSATARSHAAELRQRAIRLARTG
jgi:DNA repair protein RecN (Recombination protein N)